MNIASLEVAKGLVANKNTSSHQLIQVSAETADIHGGIVDLKWYNVLPGGTTEDPFASARLHYGNADEWLSSWSPLAHLIQGRISDLQRMAKEGSANRFSRNMAYQLFANNLVDYATKYRGMQSVTLHEFEAFAEIELSTEKGGLWTIPPFFIDSVAHLAGFIMNVTDAIDHKSNFCVTPGWNSMRFARPLVAGAKYCSYTRMIPTPQDSSIFLGDVYILQDDIIIGMVGGIKFRQYPRILLDRFFSAPDEKAPEAHSSTTGPGTVVTHVAKPIIAKVERTCTFAAPMVPNTVDAAPPKASIAVVTTAVANAATVAITTVPEIRSDSTTAKAVALIAEEAGLEVEDMVDEASFASLGVDSLMSLVIAEKFREQLGVTVGGSLFLEYPTVGDLTAWLEEYYS